MGIIRKLKEIDPEILNRLRWIFLASSAFFLILIDALETFIGMNNWFDITAIINLLLLITILPILMMVRKETINKRIILFIIILACLFGLIYLFVKFVVPLWKIDRTLDYFVREVSSIIAVSSVILIYIIYFRFVEIIIPLSILIILTGLFLNRIGAEYEAVTILFLGFGFITIGFIHASIRSLRYFKEINFVRRLLLFLGIILACCSAIFLVRFSSWEAAHTSKLDFFGAILFLAACLLLFAAMPFSNFIEWTKNQKRSFYRLFLIPMIFFLVLFSLKFLLPGTTYQKLFFKGYAEKEKVYFGMKKYELPEPEAGEINQD